MCRILSVPAAEISLVRDPALHRFKNTSSPMLGCLQQLVDKSLISPSGDIPLFLLAFLTLVLLVAHSRDDTGIWGASLRVDP